MVAEVQNQDDTTIVPVQPANAIAVVVPASPSAPVKKPLTLDHLRKRYGAKPLVKVEISGLFDDEIFVCWRKSIMPAALLEDIRSKEEDRNTLKTLLDAVSELTLDEQGQPLGTREEWAQFDLEVLNSVLHALFESSNKVGEV